MADYLPSIRPTKHAMIYTVLPWGWSGGGVLGWRRGGWKEEGSWGVGGVVGYSRGEGGSVRWAISGEGIRASQVKVIILKIL